MQARLLREPRLSNDRNEIRIILRPSMSKSLHAAFSMCGECVWLLRLKPLRDRLFRMQTARGRLTQEGSWGFERNEIFFRNHDFFPILRSGNSVLSFQIPGFSSIPSKPEQEWIAIFSGKSKIPEVSGSDETSFDRAARIGIAG